MASSRASFISASSLSLSSSSRSSLPSHFQQLSFPHNKGIRVRSSPLRINVNCRRKPAGKTPSVRKPDGKSPSVREPHGKTPRVREPDVKIPSVREPDVVTANTWDKLISDSDIPVLVEFHASWCENCGMIHRVIDELAAGYAGRLKCFVLPVDSNLQVSSYYHIKVMPAVLLFKNGRVRETLIGTMPKEFYAAAIEKFLTS